MLIHTTGVGHNMGEWVQLKGSARYQSTMALERRRKGACRSHEPLMPTLRLRSFERSLDTRRPGATSLQPSSLTNGGVRAELNSFDSISTDRLFGSHVGLQRGVPTPICAASANISNPGRWNVWLETSLDVIGIDTTGQIGATGEIEQEWERINRAPLQSRYGAERNENSFST